MSTSIATPPSAIANNLGIGHRQTVATVADDIKVDDQGWQAPAPGEWTTVSYEKKSPEPKARPSQPTQTGPRWMPRPVQGPALPTVAEKKEMAAAAIEERRVRIFRKGVAQRALPAIETMAPHYAIATPPPSPISAPTRSIRIITPITPLAHKRKAKRVAKQEANPLDIEDHIDERRAAAGRIAEDSDDISGTFKKLLADPKFMPMPAKRSGKTTHTAPDTPSSAPAPGKTRSAFDIRRIKAKRASGIKRDPVAQAARAAANFIRNVTKEEAAAPISTRPEDCPLTNPFAPIQPAELPRPGSGAVVVYKEPGSTHLHNHAGRNMRVRTKAYEITSVSFNGFFKSTLGSTFTPQSIGFHCAGPEMVVHLPEGLVETLGVYLVGKIPNMETYLACQAVCKNLCNPIDFETPKLMEDACIYGPYLAMISRADEREGVIRKLSGQVYTRNAMRCLKLGGLGSLVLSMPVATAATAAGAPIVAASGLAFAAATAMTLGVAVGVRAALGYFRPDERIKKAHQPLASVNSKAKTPPQHEDAVVRRLPLEKKAADATRPDAALVTGIAVEGQEPTVFAKNQDNTIKALEKRSAVKPAPFHPHDRQKFCDWVLDNWPHLVKNFMRLDVPNDPDEWLAYVLDWVAGCCSSNVVKARYEETARRLHSEGLTAHSSLTPSVIREWTKREASVKLETVLKDEDKSPRQILSATPEFVVMTAPFVKQLTGVIRRKWKPSHICVYAPGTSAKTLADTMTEQEWDNMANLDFDGYDSSQGIQIGVMEREICKRHRAPTAMLQLMAGNFETHGASREGVKFETPYVRNSGDPWTTMFNTFLNGALMTYVYCMVRECGVRDVQAKFFAGGDDGALFYNGPRINFAKHLATLGLPATVKHVNHLYEIEFLSCRLTHTSKGWNFVNMVGKTIAKLQYSVRAENPTKAAQIARGAAMSLYAASHGCPPLRAYLDAILRVTEGMKAITPRDEPWKMNNQDTGEPNAETWAHLWQIYGWDQSLQETLVARLATVKTPGTIISSPALTLLMDRDSGHAFRDHPLPPDSDDPTDFPPEATPSSYDWAITSEERNRLAHAANGNINPGSGRRRPRAANPKPTAQPRRKPRAARRSATMAVDGQMSNPSSRGANRQRQASVAAAYATGLTSGRPMIQRTTLDRTTIEHRELISPISGTVAFTPTMFAVNPGLAITFPWLSTQALGWEKYRFEYLRFCYYTRAPSSTQGSMMLVPDYDASDSPPVNELIAATYNGTQEDAAWKDMCCPWDAKILNRECFVRTAALAPNLDIKTYDIGTFFSCTTDAATGTPWGKLWVEYKVVLINPQVPSAGAGTTGTLTSGSGPTTTALFGTVQTGTGNYTLGATGNVITMFGLTIGLEYLLTIVTDGTGITAYSTSGSFVGATSKTTLGIGASSSGTYGAIVLTFIPTATTVTLTLATAVATTITLSVLALTVLNPQPAF
jgi:hypothetical protein